MMNKHDGKYTGELTHLKSSLPHQLLLLILCRVRMLQVCDKPGSQLIRRLFRKVSSPFPLLAVVFIPFQPIRKAASWVGSVVVG